MKKRLWTLETTQQPCQNNSYDHTDSHLSKDSLYVNPDNSVENALPQLLFRTVDGEVFKQYTNDVPEWAEMLVK